MGILLHVQFGDNDNVEEVDNVVDVDNVDNVYDTQENIYQNMPHDLFGGSISKLQKKTFERFHGSRTHIIRIIFTRALNLRPYKDDFKFFLLKLEMGN